MLVKRPSSLKGLPTDSQGLLIRHHADEIAKQRAQCRGVAVPGLASMGPVLVPAVDPVSSAGFPSRSFRLRRWNLLTFALPSSTTVGSKPRSSSDIHKYPKTTETSIRASLLMSNGVVDPTTPSRSNSRNRMIDPQRVNPRMNRRVSCALNISRD